MYILFDKETKIIEEKSNKPFKSYISIKNLDIAEYKGEIPKNDYLTVANLREETETFVEKKEVEKINDSGEVTIEEIEETKTRTYLACDLVANFYPPKTEEKLAAEKDKKYSDLVNDLIRKKYSQSKVEAIFANYLSKKVEEEDIAKFNQFQEYREECKKLAHKEVYGE